jgi:hypothetical protein
VAGECTQGARPATAPHNDAEVKVCITVAARLVKAGRGVCQLGDDGLGGPVDVASSGVLTLDMLQELIVGLEEGTAAWKATVGNWGRVWLRVWQWVWQLR